MNWEISAAIISWNCVYLSIIHAASNLRSDHGHWAEIARPRYVSLCDRLILQSIIFMANKFHKEARFLVTQWNISIRFCLHLNDTAVVRQVLIEPVLTQGCTRAYKHFWQNFSNTVATSWWPIFRKEGFPRSYFTTLLRAIFWITDLSSCECFTETAYIAL